MGFDSLFSGMGNLGTIITMAVAIPFVLVVIGLGFVAWRSGRKANISRNWNTAMGRVVSSSVERRRSRSGTGYSTSNYPMVMYDYTVMGQRYMGDRINFGMEVGYGWSSAAEKIVAKYPVGAMVEVYYDPNDPSQAVLERTGGTSSKILWIVAAVMLVMLIGTLAFTAGINGFVGQFTAGLPK